MSDQECLESLITNLNSKLKIKHGGSGMADKNAKKFFDIEEPEPNKTETKRSEPN